MKVRSMKKLTVMLSAALILAVAAATDLYGWDETPQIVTLDAPSPLIEVRIMIKAGSAHDPEGLEGLAGLTADVLLEGGYGDEEDPVTKEELARITRKWGQDAAPTSFMDKETTTFSMVIPKDVLAEYIEQVLEPLFTEPLFLQEEIDRIRDETLTYITGSLRYENIEMLGLEAMDNFIFRGTRHGHTTAGSVQGLKAIDRDKIQQFYKTYYRPENIILGLSTRDEEVISSVAGAIEDVGDAGQDVRILKKPKLSEPETVRGREMVIVGMPDPGATAIHAGFPIQISRKDPNFWPLYVANVYFGTHRDSHSHLYQQIRKKRGYNYGDYSYVEHFAYRPFNLFPPFNTPRSHQYFMMWIRPVADEYAHHITKAMLWEYENFLRNGVSEEDVELSKNKAKILYLNLAENSSRLLAAKMDDAFYGMEEGYLDHYLEKIDAVTREEVNAAVRRYLQPDNLKILLVTNRETADALCDDVCLDENATGKMSEDYNLDVIEEEGTNVYQIPEDKIEILKMDAVWAHYLTGIVREQVTVVPSEALFETGAFISPVTSSD